MNQDGSELHLSMGDDDSSILPRQILNCCYLLTISVFYNERRNGQTLPSIGIRGNREKFALEVVLVATDWNGQFC